MDYNPYAAPQAASPEAPGPLRAGAPQPWEIGEVYTRGWEIYKAHWGVLTGAVVVMGLLSGVPVYAVALGLTFSRIDPDSAAFLGPYWGMRILSQMTSAFFMVGVCRICLCAARGDSPQFATLFSGGSRFLPYLGTQFIVLCACASGLVLFIVPGVILGCGLWAAALFIADTDVGVIDAIRSSWEATRGHRLNYFVFGIVGFLLMIAGLLACCVGVFVTIPLFFVAQAIVFLRITGRGNPAPPEYGVPPGGYGGPPPGYGGGPPGGASSYVP